MSFIEITELTINILPFTNMFRWWTLRLIPVYLSLAWTCERNRSLIFVTLAPLRHLILKVLPEVARPPLCILTTVVLWAVGACSWYESAVVSARRQQIRAEGVVTVDTAQTWLCVSKSGSSLLTSCLHSLLDCFSFIESRLHFFLPDFNARTGAGAGTGRCLPLKPPLLSSPAGRSSRTLRWDYRGADSEGGKSSCEDVWVSEWIPPRLRCCLESLEI